MARFESASGMPDAANVTYDNTASGLSATDVAAGLDELDAEKQPVNSGVAVTEHLGTVTTGTITPEPSTGGTKDLTNGGAFTWAAPTEEGGYIAKVLNNGSAGAITASGFDYEESANFTTTDTDVFEVAVTNIGGYKKMTVVADQ